MTGDENRPALSGTGGIAAWHEDVRIHVPSPNREPACVVEHAEKRYTNSRYFWMAATFPARSRRGRELYENPIQRPPQATPNHRTNDTSAVDRLSRGRSDRSICTTRRRTVNVKRSTRKSDVIFTQKAKL